MTKNSIQTLKRTSDQLLQELIDINHLVENAVNQGQFQKQAPELQSLLTNFANLKKIALLSNPDLITSNTEINAVKREITEFEIKVNTLLINDITGRKLLTFLNDWAVKKELYEGLKRCIRIEEQGD